MNFIPTPYGPLASRPLSLAFQRVSTFAKNTNNTVKTVALTAGGYAAANGVGFMTEHLFSIDGNNAGQATIEEMADQNPVAAAVILAGAFPLMEESLFRFAPNVILNFTQMLKHALFPAQKPKSETARTGCLGFFKNLAVGDGSPQWGAGILSAAVFAAAHGIDANDAGEMFYNTDILPVPQFLLGLLFWNLMRTKGPQYALLSHMLVNGSAVLMMSLT